MKKSTKTLWITSWVHKNYREVHATVITSGNNMPPFPGSVESKASLCLGEITHSVLVFAAGTENFQTSLSQSAAAMEPGLFKSATLVEPFAVNLPTPILLKWIIKLILQWLNCSSTLEQHRSFLPKGTYSNCSLKYSHGEFRPESVWDIFVFQKSTVTCDMKHMLTIFQWNGRKQSWKYLSYRSRSGCLLWAEAPATSSSVPQCQKCGALPYFLCLWRDKTPSTFHELIWNYTRNLQILNIMFLPYVTNKYLTRSIRGF